VKTSDSIVAMGFGCPDIGRKIIFSREVIQNLLKNGLPPDDKGGNNPQ
jgi:hypothetical protein